ncbi:MAG: hypothetical protein C4530_10795 [Desulfobacteraceae bacterium]|nr:MAG: hypothetical protein C4530_10795 [Desulfobacteraceae bacterium]
MEPTSTERNREVRYAKFKRDVQKKYYILIFFLDMLPYVVIEAFSKSFACCLFHEPGGRQPQQASRSLKTDASKRPWWNLPISRPDFDTMAKKIPRKGWRPFRGDFFGRIVCA